MASVRLMLMLSTPLMAILVFHLDLALVWTQSPRVLMLLPKELFPILVTMLDMLDILMVHMLDTTMASVKLMLMLSTPLMAILVFHLDPALVWTQLPRVLMLLPKELFPILVTMLDMLISLWCWTLLWQVKCDSVNYL